MQKPNIIQQIENIYGDRLALQEVSRTLPHPLNELMAFKEGIAKYLVDEQEQLIGLNLAATELDDGRWQEIIHLFEQHDVHLQALIT